ncbi:Xylanase inhibitor, C-terminal [Dillenia turbinata]|uniref:Xylanase inhibitor, C-terminal n=1 Tax=Dillenia turbinata TaxID=194707 RepID=A0AAN8YTF5_9MAGN
MHSLFTLLIFSLLLEQVVCSMPLSLNLERSFPVKQRINLNEVRARDEARHARILQGRGGGLFGGVVDFSIGGISDPNIAGLYYTKVKLGSPPKEFTVQIDTGSDILWVTCDSCSNCPQSSGLGIALNSFDPGSSSTVSSVSCSDQICGSLVQTTTTNCSTQSNQCSYMLRYGDGSGTSGYYVSDLLSFDMVFGNSLIANASAPIVFGCSTYHYGDLTETDRAVDGIFGFGPQDLSVISQLSSRGLAPKVFSHCLKGDGKGGGILVFGEIVEPSIVYSPLVPLQSHYNLVLESIAVNGQLLPIDPALFSTASNQGTMVDSGTTLVYLVGEAYDPFITVAIPQSVTPIQSQGTQCYQVSTGISEIFPSISLNFAGGAPLVLRPEDYLVQSGVANGAALWCIGFLKTQNQGMTILGGSSPVNVSINFGRDKYVNAGQLTSSSASRNKLLMMGPRSKIAFVLLCIVIIQILFL